MEKVVRIYYQHQLENYNLQATTDVDDIEESTSDLDKYLPSCYLPADSDILKSIANLLELVYNVKISYKLKQIYMSQKKRLSTLFC